MSQSHKKTRRVSTAFVEKQKAVKAAKRQDHSLELMKNYPGAYSCFDCVHGKNRSCKHPLPNGCENFYDAIADRRFESKNLFNQVASAL